MAEMTAEERKQLLDTIAGFVQSKHNWMSLRDEWADASERDSNRNQELCAMGVHGLRVPEEFGGTDLADVDAVATLETLAYNNIPDPVMETMWVAAPVLAAAPRSDALSELLTGIVGGMLFAVARDKDKFVADVNQATYLMTIDTDCIRIVSTSDLQTEYLPSQDPARRLSRITGGLDRAEVLTTNREAISEAMNRLRIGHAVVLNGLSRRILDITVDYVKGREQFGRPVGSFQGLKHILADVASSVYLAQNSTWGAARRLRSGGVAADGAARAAQIISIEAHHAANDAGLQCHGGIGFTWEYELHELLKRGKALQYAQDSQDVLTGEMGDLVKRKGVLWA